MIENKSGIRPIKNSVLILPKQISEKTESGIVIGTPGQVEREQMAQTEGVVVGIGRDAFVGFEDTPAIGDEVVFSKYAGMMRDGNDGLSYRLISDEDVRAIVTKME